MFSFRKIFYLNLLIVQFFSLTSNSGVFGQGTEVKFSTIPKSGTILVYSHMDDDLIWMLPFWKITEKFIGGAMPATPSYKTIINQQQTFLDNNGYNINYKSNWFTPWDDITDTEYSQYYLGDNPAYSYLVNDHIESRLFNDLEDLSRYEINKIKAKLEQYFASPDMARVITHNNWGEYGHKHHVGINKAVRELAVKYRKDVWMLGCDNGAFIDISVPNGITFAYGSFNQPDLYLGIRTIYQNNGRWTWYTDRVPSGDHKFIKIVDAGNDKSNILKGDPITYPGPSQAQSGAYIFDGDDDYMTLKGNNYSSFTISLRFRPSQIREMDISSMAEYPFSTKNDRNIFITSEGKITARIFDGSSRVVTSNSSVQAGNWSHVAITGNGGNLKLYVNGILERTVSAGTAITNYATPELVLGLATETTSNFIGQINDVHLYNRVLTDNEIVQLSGMVRYITATSGSGGTVTPSGTTSVSIGSSFIYTISPNNGFSISDVRVDNISRGPLSTYTFKDVTQDHTISATFTALNSYTMSSSAGTGGSINPSGTRTLYQGSDLTYTITANTGYRISDVIVDDISMGKVSSYTFRNIRSSHAISATFTPITYTINGSAGNGGTISFPGITTIEYGNTMVYTIIPETGYEINDVVVDNKSVGPVGIYTFTNIKNNHTISASFKIITYAVSVNYGLGGSVDPYSDVRVDYGSDQSFIVLPDTGYKVIDLIIDGVSIGPASDYIFRNITTNHSISATFKLMDIFKINTWTGEGGTINPSGQIRAFEGTDHTYYITPDPGYRIYEVVIDNQSAGTVSEITFKNLSSDHSISVMFSTSTEIKVFPNPFTDNINISIANPGERLYDLVIYDMAGKVVQSQNRVPGNSVTQVTLKGPSGSYILRIFYKGARIGTYKIIKS